MRTVKIKKITKIKSDSKRYDIQTKRTNNFFANNILVHNSLIQLYYDWNQEMWHVGTTGTAEAEGEVNNKYSTTFADLFWSTISKYDLFGGIDKMTPKERTDYLSFKLSKGHTYAFELTTPYNIVVKPHAESSATLLTVRNLETGEELSRDELTKFIDKGVPIVKAFKIAADNVGHILKTFENMPYTEEGYVVVDKNFNRIKIKNPAYVSAHHIKGKMASHHIMGIIKTNECDEFIATFMEREDEIRNLEKEYQILLNKLFKCWNELSLVRPNNITPQEKKKFAMNVFDIVNKYNVKQFSGLFFALNDGKINSIKEYMMNYDDKKLYNFLIK